MFSEMLYILGKVSLGCAAELFNWFLEEEEETEGGKGSLLLLIKLRCEQTSDLRGLLFFLPALWGPLLQMSVRATTWWLREQRQPQQ